MVPAQDEHEGGLTYRDAGVDIDKATASLTAIGKLARSTMGAGTSDADFGHFGGVFPLPSGPDRLLVASADGIGTKIKIAFVIGGWAHKRVGGDLVRHCVNDVLACGARPLFFLDYIAMGSLDTATLASLVEGMAEACRENGLALIGGETAEMPGLYAAGEYDAAGFIVGEVAPGKFVDGSAVRAGDRLIGFPSTGLHTNGYSLARKIIGMVEDQHTHRTLLDAPLSTDSRMSLGDALLADHRSYLPQMWPLLEQELIHGMAHITGGGLLDNVPRMIPDGFTAVINPATWTVPPIFEFLNERGGVDALDRYRAFNMGIGFVAAVAESNVDGVLALNEDAMVIGTVGKAVDNAKVKLSGVTG